ncbi:hypothetical protein KAR91_10460 [Candidatus Pacearchaeota archaeon]|nr:hypothetical protein [Candidatus Pacearchaeota archaeon]
MGTCGCGDGVGDWKFPAPDGNWYTLRIYRGCKDCHTPWYVIVARLTPEEAADFEVEHLPDLKFRSYAKDDPNGDAAVEIIDFEKVQETIIAKLNEAAEYYFIEAVPEAVDDVLRRMETPPESEE